MKFRYITLCTVVVFEIVSSLLSRPIMEHELFGRKKTIYYSLFMVGLFSLSLMIAQEDDFLNFLISFIGIKMFITLAFMVIFQVIRDHFPLYRWNLFGFDEKKTKRNIFGFRQSWYRAFRFFGPKRPLLAEWRCSLPCVCLFEYIDRLFDDEASLLKSKQNQWYFIFF